MTSLYLDVKYLFLKNFQNYKTKNREYYPFRVNDLARKSLVGVKIRTESQKPKSLFWDKYLIPQRNPFWNYLRFKVDPKTQNKFCAEIRRLKSLLLNNLLNCIDKCSRVFALYFAQLFEKLKNRHLLLALYIYFFLYKKINIHSKQA